MKRACLPGTILIAIVGAFAQPQPGAQPTHAWDLAVIDRLLVSSPANSKTVRAGDMILRRSYVKAAHDWLAANGTRPELAFGGGVVLWPGGVVPYEFDAGVSALHQKAFLDAATDWATFANVSFVARTNQADYIYVQEGVDGDNSAGVGKLGGQQVLTISAWPRNVICHEIGHTLGLVHEHQRSDRNSFVTIQSQNIQPGFESAFAILPNSNNRGGYDFLSVMHCARNALATDPSLDTVVPALSGVVTNSKDSGAGSLRAAIFYAIDYANTTITFNIPANDLGHIGRVYVIQPSDVMTTPGPGQL